MRASIASKGCCVTAAWIAVAGCQIKSEPAEDDAIRGGDGESCTSRRDCEKSLACIDNRCTKPGATMSTADGGMSMVVADTRGATGESCTHRADCKTGNACIDNVCVDEGDLPEGMPPSVRGDRGESCQARNDCKAGLACINQRCLENDFAFEVQPKECFRVQCEADEDCCSGFVAPFQCPQLQTACDGGDTASCTVFMAQCMCAVSCQAQICAPANQCTLDTDCGSTALHCFGGRCAQCMVSTDCPGTDLQCTDGVCRAACTRNEQCPLFFACNLGECVDVGCQSARECYFATKNPQSECSDGECLTPCENDAECGELQACDEGRCRFVGCENDEECRIYLGLANLPNSEHAVCREPDR